MASLCAIAEINLGSDVVCVSVVQITALHRLFFGYAVTDTEKRRHIFPPPNLNPVISSAEAGYDNDDDGNGSSRCRLCVIRQVR